MAFSGTWLLCTFDIHYTRNPRGDKMVAMPIPVQIRVTDYAVIKEASGPVKESFDALLIDISEFGIGLLSPSSLPWGALVEMRLDRSALPLTNLSSRGLMQITGRVVHAIPQGNQYRLGVSFIRLEETDRAIIQQLTASHERRRAQRVPLLQTAVGS